jgi:hypothetical protein
MTFHINTQQADHISNVAGNQYNAVQHTDTEARALLGQLLAAVQGAEIPPSIASKATKELGEAGRELARPAPSKAAIADRLARVTKLLVSVGALAAAGTALGAPLAALAGWLGGLGDPIRRHLA